MLDFNNLGIDINMFSKEYMDGQDEQFSTIMGLLQSNKSQLRKHPALQYLKELKSGEACPICDSVVVDELNEKGEKQGTCHACGLHQTLTPYGEYSLTMEEIIWDITLSNDELTEETTTLFTDIQKSQSDILAFYRLVLNGQKIENVYEELEKMKHDISQRCETLTNLLQGEVLAPKRFEPTPQEQKEMISNRYVKQRQEMEKRLNL